MANFYQGWTRAVLVLLLVVPIVLIRKEVAKIKKEDRKWLIVFLAFTSLTQAPIFYAFNHLDIGSATLLFFVSMFLTMNVVGICFLSERFTKVKMVSVLMSLSGMFLVFSFSMESFTLLAALAAILNGVASGGGGWLFQKRFLINIRHFIWCL